MKRALFVLSAGLAAAALANPIVENVSDTGVFGPHFADHDQSGAVPALLLASVLALAFVAMRTFTHWIAGFAHELSSRPLAADLPLVFAVQFVAEYAMESAERLVHGASMSGAAWVGGPVAFALAVHTVVGIAITFGLARALCAFARSIATTLRAVVEAFAAPCASRTPAAYAGRRDRLSFVYAQLALDGPRRGRAPPATPTPAV